MRQKIFKGMGILAAVLLAVLLGVSFQRDTKEQGQKTAESETEDGAFLEFDPEELVYDGSGSLDLLHGVKAVDEDGTDITSQVNAVITGDSQRNRKRLRYSVFSASGREITAERTLVMKDYQGPEITLSERELSLETSDLDDLVSSLQKDGKIKGADGYGQDITSQITWKREKISGRTYRLTFQLENAYLDQTQAEATAKISGEVQDITLTLAENRITIPQGTGFSPIDYLEEARDPAFGSIADRVWISSNVDVNRPGSYSVVYSVTSVDNTQTAKNVLTVTVE